MVRVGDLRALHALCFKMYNTIGHVLSCKNVMVLAGDRSSGCTPQDANRFALHTAGDKNGTGPTNRTAMGP